MFSLTTLLAFVGLLLISDKLLVHGVNLIGCYEEDTSSRSLSFEAFSNDPDLSAHTCVDKCADYGFNYAGIFSGHACYCGNGGYDKYGTSKDCLPCPADLGHTCGSREAISVYETGAAGPDPPSVIQLEEKTRTSFEIHWDPPTEKNSNATLYKIRAIPLVSYNPRVKGHDDEFSKTYVASPSDHHQIIEDLLPGTQYEILVQAAIEEEVYGRAGIRKYWTNIGVPESPCPPELVKRSTEQISIYILPTNITTGPITSYWVIVKEIDVANVIRDEDLFTYAEAKKRKVPFYVAGAIDAAEIGRLEKAFTVGSDQVVGGYYNPRLLRGAKGYTVVIGVKSEMDGLIEMAFSDDADTRHPECPKHDHSDALGDGSAGGGGGDDVVVTALIAAICVLGFLLICALIFYICLRRYMLSDKLINDEDLVPAVENGGLRLSDMSGAGRGSNNVGGIVNPGAAQSTRHDLDALYRGIRAAVWLIPPPPHQLHISGKVCGYGRFGAVRKAQVEGMDTCVVTYKGSKDDDMSRRDFILELDTLRQLGSHDHLLSLIGISEEPNDTIHAVLEYWPPESTLLEHLRQSRINLDDDWSLSSNNKISRFTEQQLLNLAIGVARGMQHLALHRVIHRSLSSKKVILGDHYIPKITDYSLLKYSQTPSTSSTALAGGSAADSDDPSLLRTASPEAIRHRVFTSRGDVWSYGVLLWQVATVGATPYYGARPSDIINRLEQGVRLAKPTAAAPTLYQLMLNCWEADTEERPSFGEIIERLEASVKEGHLNLDWHTGYIFSPIDTSLTI